MSFCLMMATAAESALAHLTDQAASVLKNLSPAHAILRQEWGWCSVITAQLHTDRRSPWVISQDGTQALVSGGSWFYGAALASGQEQDLLARAQQTPFDKLLDNIEGVFSIALLDKQKQRIDIAVDPAGSFHVYRVQYGNVLLLSDSALTLAALTQASLNPEGVLSFIATGIVYGQLSVWQQFTKLAPAEHVSLQAFKKTLESKRYWQFTRIQPEKYSATEGAAKMAKALTATASHINRHFPNALCDLTGGYDSRATLSGFLLAHINVSTTVSGDATCADARVAKRIADHFNLSHRRVDRKSNHSYNDLYKALLLTDGEFDVFEYASIAHTHNGHVAAGHDISINGSFGELARGYWWELLFPKIGKKIPLEAHVLARKRFAAIAYNRHIFADKMAHLDLTHLLAEQTRQHNQALLTFPNTTQMDHAYYAMRMQRWQGRIASSTNRIWPAVSPFAFRPIMQIVLETQAKARLRSLLVRTLLANHLPALGQIPLEHGYPAMPATLSNIFQFTSVITHYSTRIIERLKRRWRNPSVVVKTSETDTLSEDPQLLAVLSVPHLSACGLFKPEPLQDFMHHAKNKNGEQWRRLVTLEMAVATVHQLRSTTANVNRSF